MRPGGLRGHRQGVRDRRPGTMRRPLGGPCRKRNVIFRKQSEFHARCIRCRDRRVRPAGPRDLLPAERVSPAGWCWRRWRRGKLGKSLQSGSRGSCRGQVRTRLSSCVSCVECYVLLLEEIRAGFSVARYQDIIVSAHGNFAFHHCEIISHIHHSLRFFN